MNPPTPPNTLFVKGVSSELKRLLDTLPHILPKQIFDKITPIQPIKYGDQADLDRQLTPEEIQQLMRREFITKVELRFNGDGKELKGFILEQYSVTVE